MSDDDWMQENWDEPEGEEEGEEEVDPLTELENHYYVAKEEAEENKQKGLEKLQELLLLEQEKTIWGFKALKRICKILFHLGRHEELVENYQRMMSYTKKTVTMNESDKAINSLLDLFSASPKIREIYQITLDSLKEGKNEKAYLRLQIRLARTLKDLKNWTELEKALKELYAACQVEGGHVETVDSSKASQLMEVLALEIVMHTERGNFRKLKELYNTAKVLSAKAISAPLINGVIHECGGKMFMREKNWKEAYGEFFQAFNNYDEVGSLKAVQCLKYLVFANVLSTNEINPFEEPRAKAHQNKEEIQAMLNLVTAYQKGDIKEFEKILKKNKKSIYDDDFLRLYLEDLLTNVRTTILQQLIKPYTCIRLEFIAEELNITVREVESLLVALILDHKITGSIDQINKMLMLSSARTSLNVKYDSINKWATQLGTIQGSVFNRIQ